MRRLTLLRRMRITLMLLIGLFLVINTGWAQLTQYTTTTTDRLSNIHYDPEVEGRVFGFNWLSYPQVFVSEDYGTTWRLLYTFTDPMLPTDIIRWPILCPKSCR